MQRFWNQEEVTILRTMAGRTPATKIGITLDRTKSSVLAKIRALGIQGIPQGPVCSLTDAQIADLEHIAPGVTGQQFAASHDLRVGVVRYWARKIGVKFKPERCWTEEDRRILREAKDIQTAMAELGRSRRVVYDQARLIGVKLGGINHPGQTITRMRVSQTPRKIVVRHPLARYRSMVWSCGCCHCPVSNWEQHYSRMPQCRIARTA